MDRTIPVEEIYRTLLEMEESDWIEAKSLRRDSTRSLLETVCSFSNEPHLGGGCILVGVAEDRERHDGRFWVDGVDAPDKAQADIATQCASVFNRPVRPAIRPGTLEGKTVLAVFVDELPPASKPLFFKATGLPQGAFRRIGSTDQHCTEDDLAVFFGDEESFDRSRVKGALLSEADPSALARYRFLRRAVNPAADELSLDDADLLRALGCVHDEHPEELDLAGVLLFGSAALQRRTVPAVRADYIRVPGTEWVANPGEEFRSADMRGPLVSLVDRLVDAVLADVPRGFRLEEGSLQAQSTGLPVRALREAVVNALMHRSYRVHQPIQIVRYDNRIEIINAGSSLKPEEELGTPGSRIRNPTLANVFHDTNLAETKGTGIHRMRRLLSEAHLAPPTFESDHRADTFTVRLLLHHFLGESDLAWLRRFEEYGLGDGQKTALVFLREIGAIDNTTYRQMTGLDSIHAGAELRKMRQLGLLVPKGRGIAAYYGPGPVFAEKSSGNPEMSHETSHEMSHGDAGVSHETSQENSNATQETSEDSPMANGVRRNTAILMKDGKILIRDGKILVRTEMSVVREGKAFRVPKPLSNQLVSLKKRERNRLFLQTLVYDLCEWMPLTREEITQLIGRRDQYVRKLLSAMIGKHLAYAIPDMVRHPNQAYKSIPGHRPDKSKSD